MANKAAENEEQEITSQVITAKVPDILQVVEDYTYINHMRVVSTQWEVRIAVADIKPVGSVSKPIGLVMSHRHAKEFASVLKRVMDKIGADEPAEAGTEDGIESESQ
jgi:hypothetical protein